MIRLLWNWSEYWITKEKVMIRRVRVDGNFKGISKQVSLPLSPLPSPHAPQGISVFLYQYLRRLVNYVFIIEDYIARRKKTH